MTRIKVPKKILPNDMYVKPLLPALLVFLAFMVIIGVSFHTARQDILTQQADAVKQDATFVESTLLQRFAVYENSLRSANGFFLSSDIVTRTEWTEFVNNMDLTARYPGIRGLGFVKIINASEKDALEASNRAEGLVNYTVHPVTQNQTLAPLQYIVPLGTTTFTDRTSPALGFDMYSDSKRALSMHTSAKTGQATLSGIVNLVQLNDTPVSKGFLLFLPLYKKGMPTITVAQRLAALDGYFYAPFITGSVFSSLFTISDASFSFVIYDGKPSKDTLLYQSATAIDSREFSVAKTSVLPLFGESWTLVYKIKKEIVPYSVRARPLSVLVGGSIFSASLALIIYLLIQRRTRTLAYGEQKKLEEAKDELLSLASHQLRTPATAVKQYVSMVKEGFAGELTAEQRKLLQMAYDSNERQLTIVDDLLYVARVDAGKATLKLEEIDLFSLVASVITDQSSVIKARKQRVQFKCPQRTVRIMADPQYLRMILENLLSNASKYSHENTKIKVATRIDTQQVLVSITDNGVGIKPADYNNLFLKFSRIPNELTRQTQGSGIGLYLAKQLALLHGGDLIFESKEGKGTTFTLVLPRNRGYDNA